MRFVYTNVYINLFNYPFSDRAEQMIMLGRKKN